MMGYGFMGGGVFMLLFWVLCFGGIAWLVASLVNGRNYSRYRSDDSPDAIDILDRRFAEGELSKEQYVQMKQDLKA